MKIILTIFCGLVALFAGGCALILLTGAGYNGMFQTVPGAVIPGGIAVLNVLVIMALFGTSKPQRWAFYSLAVLDVLAIVALLLMWSGFGLRDFDTNVIATVLIGVFVIKAALTLLAVRRI